MTLKAYAKINLYLDVQSRRPDGYHNIESVMQEVSLFDYITVVRSDDSGVRSISILCTDKKIPEDKSNIAYRCAAAFMEHFGIEEYNITIHIDKRIPAAAGLAGGSSDGAAVLKILNTLFGVNAELPELCAVGTKIGADIPFCLIGGTCICSGIGDILIPQKIAPPQYKILIVFPGNGIATAAAYKAFDELNTDETPRSADDVLISLKNGRIPTKLYNSFERVILPAHSDASAVKKILAKHAVSSLMSGSGPSVFGLFRDDESARHAYIELLGKGFRSYICSPDPKK